MAKIDSERFATLARNAEVLMEARRRERRAQLAEQLAVNTEVKQHSMGFNQIRGEAGH